MRRLVFLALLLGCSPRYEAPSSDARSLLARFPSLPAGVATIERDGESFRPRVNGARVAVTLPVRANGSVSIASTVRVDVRLLGARDAAGEVVDGWVVYRDGIAGGAIFQRADGEGTEDHVLVPSSRVLSYDVDVHGAGLRFVNDTLEVLDAGGAPRLRMNAPTLIDARGKKHRATVSIDGCPVDRSAAAPWGRAFSPANHCTISLSWEPSLPHPVLVDPAWTTTTSMTTARHNHRAIVLSTGKVLVAGGKQLTPLLQLSSAELFDPATKTWASAGSMGEYRDGPGLANLGTKVLAVGGASASSTADVYDPTSGWAPVAPLPVAVMWPAAVGVGGKALVTGGSNSSGLLSASELYDPASNTWSNAGTMHDARYAHQAHLLSSGKVLVYGGGVYAVSSAELWDAGTWTLAGSTSVPFGSSILLAGDKVLAFSGINMADTTTAAELWSSSTWTAAGSLIEAVSAAPAARLGDGVLVAGGLIAGTGGISTAERWNGTSWSATSPMSAARAGCTATTLPDGSVLVAGGATPLAMTLSSSEVFGALAAGTACTVAADCASGICLGTCCTASCPAAACDMNKVVSPTCDATGACGTTSTDCGLYACASAACKTTCAGDADCGTTAFCSGSACVAKKANGATATDAKECTSGVVADGVCCDKACDGVCESCATGACTAVMGAPKHGSCPAAGADPCSATSCDGVDGKSCAKHAGKEVTCRMGTCEDGVETASAQCDGSGACPAVSTKTCAPYACDGPSCRRTCRSDLDCAKGSTCDTISHECLAADTCDGDHTIHSHDGVDKDCSPYKCAKTDCLKDCTSSDACVSGFICDSSSKLCVPPTSGDTGSTDSGGCSYHSTRSGSFPLVLLALLAIGRKRAVRAHSRRA
ncbi:MAG: Kelch repeat-containing protein [Polyangiales bacterium]